jgi:hypothetical protein
MSDDAFEITLDSSTHGFRVGDHISIAGMPVTPFGAWLYTHRAAWWCRFLAVLFNLHIKFFSSTALVVAVDGNTLTLDRVVSNVTSLAVTNAPR